MAARGRRDTGARFNVQNQYGDIDNIGRDQNIYADDQAVFWHALRDAGPGLKVLAGLGMTVALAGFAIFMFSIFSSANEPLDPSNPPGFPVTIVIGFATFFAGGVLASIAGIAAFMRRR